jgi:hypothetical protein
MIDLPSKRVDLKDVLESIETRLDAQRTIPEPAETGDRKGAKDKNNKEGGSD